MARLDLRAELAGRGIVPFIGIYDVFSARVAGRHFDSLFVSGFGFAASHYGLPDIGFMTWSDLHDFVIRLRTVLPDHLLLVDIDDGFVDIHVAEHIVAMLERAGASGIVLEDQRRPRRCGHVEGKQILPLTDYLEKLGRVLQTRETMFVVARTDATDRSEALDRAAAFAEAGADAVLIDGLPDLACIRQLADRVAVPVAFNQIAGGKSPAFNLAEMRSAGVGIAIYSTPALFAAQQAIERAMRWLSASNGGLPAAEAGGGGLAACNALLQDFPQLLAPDGISMLRQSQGD
ncbi:MAG: isocitrate lyase/PEP mutase family protein [Defluviicoccus sp.]|nr:isocitrate lyase/PEP mutase family protein [Defluviicoccus sp.]MDS4073637.1 isocitrate lyase/PEP mutase family protein [Defluviicoccus sp.]